MKISVITTSIRPEGLKITRECLLKQTFTDFEWLVDLNWSGKHDLNKAYNRCLKRAKGELIVSLQDYIKIEPDALQKIWEAYEQNPDTFMTFPVGKVDNEQYEGEPKWDWRNYPQSIMDWRMWEIDFGACPLKCIKDIGGFDEEIDGFWSCDNLNVGCRADLAGYKFARFIDIKGIAYDHDAFIEHPFRKEYKPIFNTLRMDEFKKGLKIDFINS